MQAQVVAGRRCQTPAEGSSPAASPAARSAAVRQPGSTGPRLTVGKAVVTALCDLNCCASVCTLCMQFACSCSLLHALMHMAECCWSATRGRMQCPCSYSPTIEECPSCAAYILFILLINLLEYCPGSTAGRGRRTLWRQRTCSGCSSSSATAQQPPARHQRPALQQQRTHSNGRPYSRSSGGASGSASRCAAQQQPASIADRQQRARRGYRDCRSGAHANRSLRISFSQCTISYSGCADCTASKAAGTLAAPGTI